MSEATVYRHERKGVGLAMIGALFTTIVILGMVALADRTVASAPFIARLQFALRADLFVFAWLAATIANVARMRFFSARDIIGSSAERQSEDVREAVAILQNTLEQVCLAVGAHIAFVATFHRTDALICALVLLFAAGRLLFWIGYARGPRRRAFGFALTFYPSVAILVVSIGANLLGSAT